MDGVILLSPSPQLFCRWCARAATPERARSAVIYIGLCAVVGCGLRRAAIVLIRCKTNGGILHVQTFEMRLAAAVRAFLSRLTKS